MIKYFVVSLPRTGTSSICEMAKYCGLNPKHTPHFLFENYLKDDKYDFFSDTPVFSPSIIKKIIHIHKNIDARFIFIDRKFDDVFDSWVRVNLYKNYYRMTNSKDKSKLNKGQIFDLNSYNDSFNENFLNENNYTSIFENHKQKVISILNNHNKKLLIYNFQDGWGPFCNFIEKEIPNKVIPHLNKNKM